MLFAETAQGQIPSLQAYISPLLAAHPGLSGGCVLDKGEEALLARGWLADHAEHTIDVQYFIWSSDNIGILAAEALLRAAKRGVRVRVIVDDLLIDAPDKNMLALAAHPNIQVKIYNPKHKVGVNKAERIFNMLWDFRAFNQRMHDKAFIVDSITAITGGRNMADEYFDYDHDYNFRDRDILLLGPIAQEMELSFESFWKSPLAIALEKRLADDQAELSKENIEAIYAELHAYAANPENFTPEIRQILAELPNRYPQLQEILVWEEIELLHDIPGKNNNRFSLGGSGQTTQRLTSALNSAQKSIIIQSPYLVMPEGAIDFFKQLVGRGVDISISTNSLASTDNLMAFSGYSWQRNEILEAGIKVFEFRPAPAIQQQLIARFTELKKSSPVFAIHAKTMVIDGETLFIGTFNLDPRSANLNTEIGVLLNNKELAGQVESAIKRDMKPGNSWNADSDDPDSQASFYKRLKVTFWKLLPINSLL